MLGLFLSFTEPVLSILVGFKATWLREKTELMVGFRFRQCLLASSCGDTFSKLSTKRNLDVKWIKYNQNCKGQSNNELGFSLVNQKKQNK